MSFGDSMLLAWQQIPPGGEILTSATGLARPRYRTVTSLTIPSLPGPSEIQA